MIASGDAHAMHLEFRIPGCKIFDDEFRIITPFEVHTPGISAMNLRRLVP